MMFSKNKKGSVLVERILMVAFAVAAGGAVIVYGSNVIVDAKNTQITGILDNDTGGQMTQEEINSCFNDSTKTASIPLQKLQTSSFSNLNNLIQNDQFATCSYWGSSISYNGVLYPLDEPASDSDGYYVSYAADDYNPETHTYTAITFGYCSDYTSGSRQLRYGITLREINSSVGKGYVRSFEGPLTWTSPDATTYNAIKTALMADLA